MLSKPATEINHTGLPRQIACCPPTRMRRIAYRLGDESLTAWIRMTHRFRAADYGYGSRRHRLQSDSVRLAQQCVLLGPHCARDPHRITAARMRPIHSSASSPLSRGLALGRRTLSRDVQSSQQSTVDVVSPHPLERLRCWCHQPHHGRSEPALFHGLASMQRRSARRLPARRPAFRRRSTAPLAGC